MAMEGDSKPMAKHGNQYIVIADGGHARFVRPQADNGLRTEEALDSAALHKQTRDLVSDRAGRAFDSSSPARHALAARSDARTLEKGRFARLVGEKICTAAAGGGFDELVLVAPSRILIELEATLDAGTRARLVGRLAKDLVGVPDHELRPHLRHWVGPLQRA